MSIVDTIPPASQLRPQQIQNGRAALMASSAFFYRPNAKNCSSFQKRERERRDIVC